MKIRFSLRARADLRRIYIDSAKTFGPQQAEVYQQGLFDSFKLIADYPLMAKERLGYQRPVRFHTYESHVIAYWLDKHGVWVVRIVHAHQNLRRIL